MKIAIIGTGNVGTALGASLVRAGHTVTLTGQDAAKATAAAALIGAGAGTSLADAVEVAEVVVLAVPYGSVEAVAADIAAVIAGKVVIDATNPLKADYSGLATEGGPSGAERIAALLPTSRVVKAFNTLFASIQGNPDVHGQMVDALLAGDDVAAKAVVASLIKSIGLRPVDAGSISGARELEALAWLNISLQMRTGGNWNSSFVLVGAPDKAIAA
jgi:predicted dinucleotide-binding enzyme